MTYLKCLILVGLLTGAGAARGEEKLITLKNGRTLPARTLLGYPVHNKSEYINIHAIHPWFETLGNWRTIRLMWRLEFLFNKPFDGTITVDSPSQERLVYNLSYQAPTGAFGGGYVVHYLDVLEREDAPRCWDWLDEQGDSWIPLHVVVRPHGDGKPADFIEWARMGDTVRRDLRAAIEKVKVFEKGDPLSVVMPDGTQVAIQAKAGWPVRFANSSLEIANLSPGVGVEPREGKAAKVLVWVLEGRYRGGRASTLKLTAPWLDKGFSQSVEIKGNGTFSIPFAPAGGNPAFWRWMAGKEDLWLAVQVEVACPELDKTYRFNEAVHISPAFRKDFQEWRARSFAPTGP